jgi:signal transduction histidine kinase
VSDGRLVVSVTTHDMLPLALVLVDASLGRHGGLVRAAVTVSALALENARLQASVRSQLAEVRASRSRMVQAALTERRRLERDLHDGAQQRLLALTMRLAAARAKIADPAVRASMDYASAEVHTALQELRDLAHGIHPAVLNAGLGAALDGVAARSPIPVTVTVPAQRCDPAVEYTAYCVINEALANVVKHAKATAARVDVSVSGGDLWLEVVDDGTGGAAVEAGTGLAGLRDRVAALGGELSVLSPAGGGTRVVARVPCA